MKVTTDGEIIIKFSEPILPIGNVTVLSNEMRPAFRIDIFSKSEGRYVENAIASWEAISIEPDGHLKLRVVWTNPFNISIY